MKLTVLALDYDGTITRDDRPDRVSAQRDRVCAAAQCHRDARHRPDSR